MQQTRQSLGVTILRTTSATYTATGKQATATDANGTMSLDGRRPLAQRCRCVTGNLSGGSLFDV